MSKIYLKYKETKIELIEGSIINIGKKEDNHLIIDKSDKYISRHHATISRVGDKIIIKDHSTNGTYILRENGNITTIENKEIEFHSNKNTRPISLHIGISEVDFIYELKLIELQSIVGGSIEQKTDVMGNKTPENKINSTLTLANIELIAEKMPDAGAVMLRKLLEIKIFEKMQKDLELAELIQIFSETRRIPKDVKNTMQTIRIIGNRAAHKESIPFGIAKNAIEDYKKIEGYLR